MKGRLFDVVSIDIFHNFGNHWSEPLNSPFSGKVELKNYCKLYQGNAWINCKTSASTGKVN